MTSKQRILGMIGMFTEVISIVLWLISFIVSLVNPADMQIFMDITLVVFGISSTTLLVVYGLSKNNLCIRTLFSVLFVFGISILVFYTRVEYLPNQYHPGLTEFGTKACYGLGNLCYYLNQNGDLFRFTAGAPSVILMSLPVVHMLMILITLGGFEEKTEGISKTWIGPHIDGPMGDYVDILEHNINLFWYFVNKSDKFADFDEDE